MLFEKIVWSMNEVNSTHNGTCEPTFAHIIGQKFHYALLCANLRVASNT